MLKADKKLFVCKVGQFSNEWNPENRFSLSKTQVIYSNLKSMQQHILEEKVSQLKSTQNLRGWKSIQMATL